jgi:predicted ATP-dependent endonuclease of OLD family
MILGTFLRYIKTYSGIKYIPLTNGHSYCGIVGENGIGKSSVLEALDCLFNDNIPNFNIATRKSGLPTTKPHIVPIYLIKNNLISDANNEIAKALSEFVWTCDETDILSQNRPHFTIFKEQREILVRDGYQETHYLLPIGIAYNHNQKATSLSIFNTRILGEKVVDDFDKQNQQIPEDILGQLFGSLQNELVKFYDFIYIPKDIDPDNFTQLETKEIQSLMGETLTEIVEKCVPQSKIKEINDNLNDFIDKISATLVEYAFRTGGERQVNLRKHDVYKLIIDAYFKIRKLHKQEGEHWLDMNSLSSGEKQKAIIQLAYQFLKDYRKNTDKIILAIDEPESSLHMSACYDQFDKLYEMSDLCDQLLFTTHWYGFIPTIEDGCVSVISRGKKDSSHVFDLIRVANYRESVKQNIKLSKGQLPYDIRLKSINDFTQSIITSIISDLPYNWLICEGSSEKIYFETYFSEIISEKKLRIIPVGGASEIKRIYNNIQVAYEDFKSEIQGKIIMISDTDVQLVQYPTRSELKNLICLRMVNDEAKRKTVLVKIDSNPVSPKTEIEDALNGKQFYETLLEFRDDYPEIEQIIKDIQEPTEESSYFSLDLSLSKRQLLENFFDTGNVKFEFAKKYSSKNSDDYTIPDWIQDVMEMY